jgi:predicted ATP-grasp superfamily ATP-dependent carboligase
MPSAKPGVLLLDAHLRHSIAITRSLGRAGIPVIGAGPSRRFPAGQSRYMEAAVQFDAARPGSQPDELLALIERFGTGVVMAGGLPGAQFLCRHRASLEPRVRGPYNDASQFEQLANKAATTALADALGVAHPRTLQIESVERAREMASELNFPVVFKSPVDQGTVRYPADGAELVACVEQYFQSQRGATAPELRPLVQEYVDGDGYGFFALADHGDVRTYFMHRRLHEVPPTGGPSAMAISYRDPALMELGQRFFSATRWHGVAMVEFKRARRDDAYYLMEVNPKFWGSLDLAIASGANFPVELYRLLMAEPAASPAGAYEEAKVFRWLTMDLAHAVATRRLRRYLRAFGDSRIADDLDLADPRPMIGLFAKGLSQVRGHGG